MCYDGHWRGGILGNLAELIVEHVICQHISEVKELNVFVTMITMEMMFVRIPAVNDGDSKKCGGNTKVAIVRYPVLFETKLKLPCLIEDVDGICSREIKVSNLWAINFAHICIQFAIFPFSFIRILTFALCVTCAFIE